MTKVLEQIPRMKIRDTVNLWRNALGILDNPKKMLQHSLARRVIEAIGKEWTRRRNAALDPAEMFAWPSTDAERGSGDLDTSEWIEEGVLKFMGYKVGADGESPRIRELILSEVFSGPLPPVFPDAYMDEWGVPLSAPRLKKMAETIAALTRNGKRRRDSRMHAAIRDWEQDLEYLYLDYYVSKFYFAWPETNVSQQGARPAPSRSPRQADAPPVRIIAKMQKRIAEEQRHQKARAAKAARRAIHEAEMVSAQKKRRERLEAQAALEAQRKTDPEYQAKKAKRAAKIAHKIGKRIKEVIVVRKAGTSQSSVRSKIGLGAKPSPSGSKQHKPS